MNLLALILPALIPAGLDMLKSVVARFTGVAQSEPKTLADRIALMAAENDRLKAIAELDKPGAEISRFTSNFRALNRYILGDLILVVTVIYILVPDMNIEIANFLLNLSASVFSFFFGDRVNMTLRKR